MRQGTAQPIIEWSVLEMAHPYDIVVLGSGIAGSIAALVLKQAGLNVLVVERKTHPRFVIGESTIPTTSLLLHQLAAQYDVPELSQVAHYLTLRENHCAAWPKQLFWYGVHREGEKLDPRHESMLEGLLLPMGPDVHMLRADADGFLASRLEKYGIDYLEHTELLDFESGTDGIRVKLRGPQGERHVSAHFLVDATGHASFLAKRFGLRDADAKLATNTRSIFGHFTDVGDLDEALGGLNPDFRFRRTGGTMHHCFPGGWMWVIPFDNGVTSVGVQFDRRAHPVDESVTPEQELAAFLDRYPSVKAHLGEMKPIRPIIRADRVQFTCSSILGDGFILTPHAASFIEPLFSTGIVLTLSFVSRFAAAAKEAAAANDWNIERFRFIERNFFAEVRQIDRLVNGVIHSFRHYDVFKQYWRNWIAGTLVQWCTCVLAKGATRENPMLYGAGIRGFSDDLETMHQMVCKFEGDPLVLAAQIKQRVDPWWERLCAPAMEAFGGGLALGADRSMLARGTGRPDVLLSLLKRISVEHSYIDPAMMNYRHAEEWFAGAGVKLKSQLASYEQSLKDGSDYAKAFDRVLWNQNPATFDYRQVLGLAGS